MSRILNEVWFSLKLSKMGNYWACYAFFVATNLDLEGFYVIREARHIGYFFYE